MAMVLDSVVTVFLDKLTIFVKEEVGMLASLQSELKALERKVRKIQCLLDKAERRAFYDKGVRSWLAELRDVMYDADDVIDDWRASVEASFLRKLTFQHKIGKRIKGINARLEEIDREKTQFQVDATDGFREKERPTTRVSRKRSSVGDSDMVGVAIELHASSLIKILTEDGSKGKSLVAIPGMAGIGKTTLAQRIFKDKVIEASFPFMSWVCVSRKPEEIRLLRIIIERAKGNPGNADSREQLDPMLHDLVQGKKLLLVLDDVWRADVWLDMLKNLLQGMAAGSKVLVTTRFDTMATQMGAGYLHRVEQMSVEDGWSLLCKKAFDPEDCAEIQSFKDVGVKIVERYGGLPLSIKLIGEVLKGKGRREWEKILLKPVWSSSIFTESTGSIMEASDMEALYLSYENLPSYLKQCFLYLSLFPEDHVFLRRYVVHH